MSVVSAFLIGGVVGVRHALEADHLAAVATLVEDDDRPSLVGASWGVGHAIPIISLGLLFLALGVEIPPLVATAFEAVVGVVLVALGLRMLADVFDLRQGVGLFRHDHGHGHGHRHRRGDGTGAAESDERERGGHDHDHGQERDDDDRGRSLAHAHVRLGRFSLGTTHSHLDGDSFLVGLLHGFAGSGGLIVVLVSTAPTVDAGLAFLSSFSALSVATMALVSVIWGRTLGTGLTDVLKTLAALGGIAVGVLLVAEQAGVSVPL